mgnify:CR=1 FL=1
MTENPGRYFGKTLSEMQNESYQHFQEVKNEQADEQSKESETLRKNGIHFGSIKTKQNKTKQNTKINKGKKGKEIARVEN